MENMIEVTGVDLVELVKGAYALSVPLGMGWLHFTEGELTDEEARELIHEGRRTPVSLDYVKGRACKFGVYKDDDGKLWISKNWYDHTGYHVERLLERVGIAYKAE